jgi:hypothetical protein
VPTAASRHGLAIIAAEKKKFMLSTLTTAPSPAIKCETDLQTLNAAVKELNEFLAQHGLPGSATAFYGSDRTTMAIHVIIDKFALAFGEHVNPKDPRHTVLFLEVGGFSSRPLVPTETSRPYKNLEEVKADVKQMLEVLKDGLVRR